MSQALHQERLMTVIRGPHLSEKAHMASENNQVLFRVAIDATKPAIKDAIETLFKVKVKAVNTIKVKGKTKRFRGVPGRRSDYKKAIVTLEDGHTIDVTTGL